MLCLQKDLFSPLIEVKRLEFQNNILIEII